MPAVSPLSRLRRRWVVVATTAVTMLALPVSAQAGRLLVTGHDGDGHCIRDSVTSGAPGACSFVAASVNWVRAKAPDPSKPVLILDRGPLDLKNTIDKMVAAGASVPYQVVEPRSPEFAGLRLNPDTYSAIIIASSKDDPTDPTPQDLNEFDSTPDTDAINARAADIASFFNAGGGIAVMSGGAAGRANSAKYYAFLKITRGGAAVDPPFSLDPIGKAIGWQDAKAKPETDMINCCVTHISFALPAPESPLKAAELDKAGRAVTLVAETNDLSRIEEPPTTAQTVFSGAPGVPSAGGNVPVGTDGTITGSTKAVCVPKGSLKISLKRPKGVRFSKLVVYVNGRKTRTVGAKTLGTGSRTRAFTIKLSKTKTSTLRLVVTTASGRKLTYRQTFKPC